MRYSIVRQASVEDCGAACLATIAKHYGRRLTLNQVRDIVGTGQLGTSLLGLKRGAATLGLNARGVRVATEPWPDWKTLSLPAILHWKGSHWVVFYGQRGRRYVIADPAVGILYLDRQELLTGWTNGVLLLLEPDPHRFWQEVDEVGQGFLRFVRPVWNDRVLLGQALLQNLLLGLLALAFPFLLQILTDEVLVRGDTQLLTSLMLAVVIMQGVSSVLQLAQANLIAHFAQRLQLGLVLEFVQRLLNLPLAYYESRRSGEILSRLQDIQEVNQLVAQLIIGLPSQCFIALFSLGFMLKFSSRLTFLAVLFVLLMSLSTWVFLPILQQRTRRILVLEAENQGVLVETFKGAMTVKLVSAAPQFWEEFQDRFARLANFTLKTIQISVVNHSFSSFVASLSSVGLLWLGSNLVIAKELSIGQLLAFNAMNQNFLIFMSSLIAFSSALVKTKTAIQRLVEVIDATPETQGDEKRVIVSLATDSAIHCENLSFHYAGQLDLLKSVSVNIPGGEVTALMGRSGCGKSTLVKLIVGLYPIQTGNIRIGDYNLQDLALDGLRQQVVLVSQDAHFWSRSIVENFRVSSPYLSFEQIVRACKLTGADEFINQLPDKYQTVLGEFGTNLSGGQRQRLAIARAIACDPAILILDESTANLDPTSESELLDRLLASRKGRTTLLISHRPALVRRADWLIYLEQGQVKAQGTWKDLRAQAGTHQEFLAADGVQPNPVCTTCQQLSGEFLAIDSASQL